MIKWIERTANLKVIMILFGLAMAVYMVMMLVTIPAIMEDSAGVEIFDMRPMGYNDQEARSILTSLSDTGKDYYRHIQIPIDFAYPLLIALFGAFALAWARRRVAIPRWSIIVPLVAGGFDYLENIAVLVLLAGHEGRFNTALACVFTVAKSMLTTLFVTGLIIVLIIITVKTVADRARAYESR